MPFFPYCPGIGRLENGDCVFVQAFGRNAISDKDLGKTLWKIISRSGSLDETFTLLLYSGFNPGRANEALARKAISLAKKYQIPIIAQWEIVYCIWQDERSWFFDNQEEIDCLWPPEFGYFATWHVKLASCERMRKRKKLTPIELCHPAMVGRAVPIIWKMKIGLVVEGVSVLDFWKDELWVWDKDSVQSWTRSFVSFLSLKEGWLPREVLGRYAHHLVKGWVSFVPPV